MYVKKKEKRQKEKQRARMLVEELSTEHAQTNTHSDRASETRRLIESEKPDV
jgi:hypothetical protein